METQTPILAQTPTHSSAVSIDTQSRAEVLLQLGDSPRQIMSLQDSSESMNELDRFVPKDAVFE